MSEFAEYIIDQVWDRQDGRCALCGIALEETDWHAHHVDGIPGNNWADNCALLCALPDGDCHHFAHDHDWQLGALLKRRDFPFWNG